MATLHDARKTIQNGIFVFKLKKNCFSKRKKTNWKEPGGLFFRKNGFFSPLIIFQSFFVIFPWSHDLEKVTWLSAWLGAFRTPRV